VPGKNSPGPLVCSYIIVGDEHVEYESYDTIGDKTDKVMGRAFFFFGNAMPSSNLKQLIFSAQSRPDNIQLDEEC